MRVLLFVRAVLARARWCAELDNGEGVENSARERAARASAKGSSVDSFLDAITLGMAPGAEDLGNVETRRPRRLDDTLTPVPMRIQNSAATLPVIVYKTIL